MLRKLASLLALCLPVAACSNTYMLTGSGLTLGPAPSGPLVELHSCGACAAGPPDQVFAVPPNFTLLGAYRLNSPDGGYYHKPGYCDCFVGEAWMYFNSNINPYPNGGPRYVVVSGRGFDTPSSPGYGDAIPDNREDCQRYYRATRMWQQAEGTDTWVEVGQQENFGSWLPAGSGSCDIGGDLSWELQPSETNQARKLRVAVKVLVRETAQKAAVVIDQPQPE